MVFIFLSSSVSFNLKSTATALDSDAKLTIQPHGDLVHYTLHVDRDGHSRKGVLDGHVTGVCDVHTDFQAVSLKGDGTTLVTLPASLGGRKLKWHTVFNLVKPTYDWHTDVYYDHEKDATKKITITTKNQVQLPELVHSHTELTVLGDTWSVAFNGIGLSPKQLYTSGKRNVQLTVTLPTKRQLAAEYAVDVTKDEAGGGADGALTNAKAVAKFSDTVPATQKQRTLVYTLHVKGANAKTRQFRADAELKYAGFDGHAFQAAAELQHAPTADGEYRTAGGKVQLSGTVLPAGGIAVEAVVDEFCPHHAVYHAAVRYDGDKLGGALKGEYHLGGAGEKPWTWKAEVTGKGPEGKTVSAKSSGKVQLPAKSGATESGKEEAFEAEHKFEADFAGRKASVEWHAKGTARRGSATAAVQLPEQKHPVKVQTTYGVERKASEDKEKGE